MNLPFVCAESALLLSGSKREADAPTRKLPSHGTPLTAPLPPSQRSVSNSSQLFKFYMFLLRHASNNG